MGGSICAPALVHAHVPACVSAHVCVCIYMRVYMNAYTQTHTDAHRVQKRAGFTLEAQEGLNRD